MSINMAIYCIFFILKKTLQENIMYTIYFYVYFKLHIRGTINLKIVAVRALEKRGG